MRLQAGMEMERVQTIREIVWQEGTVSICTFKTLYKCSCYDCSVLAGSIDRRQLTCLTPRSSRYFERVISAIPHRKRNLACIPW